MRLKLSYKRILRLPANSAKIVICLVLGPLSIFTVPPLAVAAGDAPGWMHALVNAPLPPMTRRPPPCCCTPRQT